MIRRDVLYDQDQRTVRWCLLLAVVALCVGFLAQSLEQRQLPAGEIAATVTAK